MKNPLRRRWQVCRVKRDPINDRLQVLKERSPAPAKRLFWTRFSAEVEATRLSWNIRNLRRGTERYEVFRRP